MEHGRPVGTGYLHWRWQPRRRFPLLLFDHAAFLDLIAYKHLAFAGGSMARNQLEFLLCILAVADETELVYQQIPAAECHRIRILIPLPREGCIEGRTGGAVNRTAGKMKWRPTFSISVACKGIVKPHVADIFHFCRGVADDSRVRRIGRQGQESKFDGCCFVGVERPLRGTLVRSSQMLLFSQITALLWTGKNFLPDSFDIYFKIGS